MKTLKLAMAGIALCSSASAFAEGTVCDSNKVVCTRADRYFIIKAEAFAPVPVDYTLPNGTRLQLWECTSTASSSCTKVKEETVRDETHTFYSFSIVGKSSRRYFSKVIFPSGWSRYSPRISPSY